MIKLITELLSLIAALSQQHMEKLGIKAWKIVLGIGLALVSTFLLLISIGFFGCSLYNQLVIAVGESTASMIVGGFFLLLSIILLIISKKLIKKN